jgi:hypothetical protein
MPLESRKDALAGRSKQDDLVALIRCPADFHARGTHGHAGHSQSCGRRTIVQQAFDRRCRNVSFQHITFDLSRVTCCETRGNAQAGLQRRKIAALASTRNPALRTCSIQPEQQPQLGSLVTTMTAVLGCDSAVAGNEATATAAPTRKSLLLPVGMRDSNSQVQVDDASRVNGPRG